MLAAIFIYLAIQLAIGAYISRRIRTEGDYLLAGRKLGYTLLTFSIFATWFGAETVMGSAGQVYADGLTATNAEPFGYGLCLILMGAVFAIPLWKRKLTTLADLFEQRFGSRTAKLAALILIPGSILWAAAQVRAFGNVLTIASGDAAIPLDLAIGIAAAFVIAYTAFGGLLADAVTDVIQGAILVLGIVLVAALAIAHAGGGDAVASALSDPARVRLAPDAGWLAVAEEWAIPVFGSVIAAELVGRVVAARSGSVARTSALAAGGMYVAIGLAPVLMGLVGASLAPGLGDPEQLVPVLAGSLLPPALEIVLLGALVSAILSTVDSTLLIASGLLSHNLLVPVLGVTSERLKVRFARLGVLIFGVLAYLLALRASGVFELVEQASAFGSAGVLVCAVFGLFSRFGGASAAVGTLVVSLLVYVFAAFTGAAYPFLASLLAALVAYGVVGGWGRVISRWDAGNGRRRGVFAPGVTRSR